jgi:hypothetical protein
MSGTVMLRRVARVSMFTAVFAVALPFGLMTVVGCGSDSNEGTVKSNPGAEQNTNAMKNFMESQKKGGAKK